MASYDLRVLFSSTNLQEINKKSDRLLQEAKDVNDLMALVAAGGRASDMLARGSQTFVNIHRNEAHVP